MKAATLLSFALSAVATPLVAVQDARAAEGHVVTPGATAPSSQDLKPRYQDYTGNSKRTKVRYGPYSLPSIDTPTFMSALSGEPGTTTGIGIMLAKPCSSNCNLIVAQAGLEYPDGRVADLDGGAWLHHIVMLVGGMGRTDSTCAVFPGERFFSSGNERTPTSFGDVVSKKIKSAFPLRATDSFFMQYELMNMIKTPQTVYITVDFEYIPGTLPSGWKTAKAMWLDVTGCPGISSVNPPLGKKVFKLDMPVWTSPYNGDMLGVGGHLHDGGVNVNVYQNNKVICDSVANYGKEQIDNKVGGSMAGMAMKRAEAHGPEMDGDDGKHISQMTTCTNMGPIKKGDKIRIDANYDFTKHEGMKSPSGSYTEVMGIAILYAAMEI